MLVARCLAAASKSPERWRQSTASALAGGIIHVAGSGYPVLCSQANALAWQAASLSFPATSARARGRQDASRHDHREGHDRSANRHTRMSGGTIWAEGGLGPDPGLMMRRGTLIAPKVERLLPTFVDCGRHDLVIARIISRYLKSELGNLAPAPSPHFVRKIGGDMSVIGRGEILMPA